MTTCENGSCNLDISDEAMDGILTSFSHDKILLILKSHVRKYFLETLEKHDYKLAVVKRMGGRKDVEK